MALRVPEMCFWPAKTRKNLELFEMLTCLWPAAQIWFRHKWKKLVTASLLVLYFVWYSCVRYWNEFFSAVFHVLDWSFSYCTLTEFFAIGFQKWFDHEWFDFGVFCWKMASFVDFISVWTEICKNCSIFILFWRHDIFSMFSLRGILVCSLKMLVLFSHRILYYRLMSFSNALQLYFLSFCDFQPLFLGCSDKNLWLLLKIK